jgi:hypothetical protein
VTISNIRPYLERLRTSPHDFGVHVLDDPHCELVTGGVLERVQSELIYRRAALHGVRDIINTPPGAASWMETVAQPIWRLGHDPRLQIEVITSPGMADQARALIAHPDYVRIFPDVEPVASDDPSTLQTTAGGRVVYRTLEDPRVDFRPKLLVIDTPQTQADVATQAARDGSFARVQEACAGLSPIGSVVVVTHRLHLDDVTGRLTARNPDEGRFTPWSFPVIAQEDVLYYLGEEVVKVWEGDLLDPEAWDHVRIAQLQQMLPPASFAARYLQAPLDTPDRS